ncbi:MAG: polyphosphate polymerase domain-containing protein [Planctomycetota bacterium]
MLPKQSGPRLEVKHVVSRDRVPELLAWFGAHFDSDPHAADPSCPLIRIESVYFDTENRACYRGRSRHKLPKHRLRRYDSGAEAVLEEKLRIDDRVWKRRLPLRIDRADEIRTTRGTLEGFEEWFRARFRVLDLRPALWVAYDRFAFVGEGGDRVTIDVDSRAARIVGNDPSGFDHDSSEVSVTERAVVEVKGFPDRESPNRDALLNRLREDRAEFSKYSCGLERVGLEAPPQEKGATS